METTQVVVIGGGATGTGILRDLAMRGIEAVLIEQRDLAHGTSSRFHGLLHSGARYAVNDLESAKECIEENIILRKIAKNCVEDTGGFFVQLTQDDDSYVEQWLEGCKVAGIPVKEISVKEALESEPNLNPKIKKAFVVPDGAIDGFRLVWANTYAAEVYGAKAYTYTVLNRILVSNGRVTGIEVTDSKKNEVRQIKCNYVINAAGAWAGKVTAKAGVQIEVATNKGTLLAFNHRLTKHVVNRLRPPGDGDIIVPHGTVAIFGTTSISVDDSNCLQTTKPEITKLLELGEEMFPGMDDFRVLRSFAGVRPLYKAPNQNGENDNGRSITRRFALLDHEKDGVEGLVSVVGGKFTTYRLMAEKAVDLICSKLGNTMPCRTAVEPLMPEVSATQIHSLRQYLSKAATYKCAERLGSEVEKVLTILQGAPWKKMIICECEQVCLAEIELCMNERDKVTLNDVRRKTRMGMGTCQGMVCTSRAVGILYEKGQISTEQVQWLLEDMLEERWKGNRLISWGEQLRQVELGRNLYMNLFNVNKGDDKYEI